ncbi:MAG: hypothetical protein Kow0092_08230 [Deferrisomatales bacterium]
MIRPMRAADLPRIAALVEGAGVFRPDEAEVARQVLGVAAAEGEASGYRCRVAVDGDELHGFACYGPTPCAVGTYDLYWIAVAPAARGRGIARALLATVVREATAEGGRLLVVETSDTAPYRPARRLYRAAGFRPTARIPDFYRPGDAKLVLVRSLGVPPPPQPNEEANHDGTLAEAPCLGRPGAAAAPSTLPGARSDGPRTGGRELPHVREPLLPEPDRAARRPHRPASHS